MMLLTTSVCVREMKAQMGYGFERLCENDFRAPFSVDKDDEYYPDLRRRLTRFVKAVEGSGFGKDTVKAAKKYADKVCESLRDYYRGNVATSHQRVENLVRGLVSNDMALSPVGGDVVFPAGGGTSEIQLFRARAEPEARTYAPNEMLHLPFCLRQKAKGYRFSIPGVTSLYLSNTSYGCWIELGRPPEHDFNVSPVILEGTQRVFNLAVMTRDLRILRSLNEERLRPWIKLLVLMIATSYRVGEANRSFKSEYIVSQSIMIACKKLGHDGVAYFSKRVSDEAFARAAINLALFADWRAGRDYGPICEHLKVDESTNYQMYHQLHLSPESEYALRVDGTQYITNVGKYRRQFDYRDTEFHRFDQFLFETWDDKDALPWGNALG